MSSARTIAREWVIARLQDAAEGWNAKFPAIARSHGCETFLLDFQPSGNVIQCFIASNQEIALTEVTSFPALAIYTSVANNDMRLKAHTFSGRVVVHLDFYQRYRVKDGDGNEAQFGEGALFGNTENLADAIDETIFTVFGSPSLSCSDGLSLAGDILSPRSPVQLLGDGYELKVPFELTFQVDVE